MWRSKNSNDCIRGWDLSSRRCGLSSKKDKMLCKDGHKIKLEIGIKKTKYKILKTERKEKSGHSKS